MALASVTTAVMIRPIFGMLWSMCSFILVVYYQGRVQCYSCEGTNNDLCVVNPAAKLKKVTCPQNQYCSIVRKEIPEGTYNVQMFEDFHLYFISKFLSN